MDELLIRQAPHSPEAEQAVLGSMLIDADCVKDVMDKLQPEDFYLRQNREIFETIYSMFVYSKPIDGVTVAGEMERSGLYTDDTRGYLVQLMEVTPTSANVMEYVKIVREKALLRAVASAAADITAMVQEGTGEANAVLEAAEQKIYAIRRGRSAQNMVPISMVLQAVLERLGELTAAGGETMPGLTTGFSDVDRKINGLNKSDLLLLAGRARNPAVSGDAGRARANAEAQIQGQAHRPHRGRGDRPRVGCRSCPVLHVSRGHLGRNPAAYHRRDLRCVRRRSHRR